MEENVFGNVEDIDASLDEEFGKTTDETNDTENVANIEPTNEQSEEIEKPSNETEVKDSETDNVSLENEGEKPESKKDHAFANLRAENGNLKKERDGYKADSDYLKELALSYGYDDVSKFQEAIRVSKYQKEAEEKGYDPALYRKTMEQERRIAQLEQEREQEIQERKLERFKNALDNAVEKYGVNEQEIFERLENSGLTVETILSVDNPKILLDGILIDEIKNSAKQNQIENLQKIKDLAEGKNEQSGEVKTVTIDSLLQEDLAKYKKDNYFD